MQNGGFIMLPRSFMHWRWYHDANTARVFLHLVMSANYTEHDFEGITVHPGQAVTSRQSLAAALKLSEQQVRTALKHLKATGDITVKTTSKFSVVTINSFDRFQPSVNTSTNARPTGNRPSADFQPHYNKGIKEKGNTFSGEVIIRDDREPRQKNRRSKRELLVISGRLRERSSGGMSDVLQDHLSGGA